MPSSPEGRHVSLMKLSVLKLMKLSMPWVGATGAEITIVSHVGFCWPLERMAVMKSEMATAIEASFLNDLSWECLSPLTVAGFELP